MSNGPHDADPTEVLAAHWDESERRLYPVAMTNADAYKSAVGLVRAVADALADVADLTELAQRWERRSETLDEAWSAAGTSVGYGLGESEIAGAGFAVRRRELLSEISERRRRERIAAARAAGRAWAVIHEQGDLGSGLADPYQCVELHLASGLAVVSTVEPDPSTLTPTYLVMAVRLEDEQGPASGVDPASFGDCETDDPQRFEEHRQEMRSRVEAAGA